MRIYDTVLITAAEDIPLLEARFLELADLDVVHVICESPAAYDGSRKETHFLENRGRFPAGRWNHVRVEAHELPDQEPALRKNALREYLFPGITGGPGDIVLHGGVDEIPSAEAVAELTPGMLPAVLEMRMCAYSPGYVHPDPWLGTAAILRQDLDSLAKLRSTREGFRVLHGGGTRLAMMGAGEGDRYPDGKTLIKREPDQAYPRYVRERRYPSSWVR